jgi:hypothetical protein
MPDLTGVKKMSGTGNMVYLPNTGLAFPAIALQQTISRVLVQVKLYQSKSAKIEIGADGYYNLNAAEVFIKENVSAQTVFVIDVPSTEDPSVSEQYIEPGQGKMLLLSSSTSLEEALMKMSDKRRGILAKNLKKAADLQNTIRQETRSPLEIMQEEEEEIPDTDDDYDDSGDVDNSADDYDDEDDGPVTGSIAPEMIAEMRKSVAWIVEKIEKSLNREPVVMSADGGGGGEGEDDASEAEESMFSVSDVVVILEDRGSDEEGIASFRRSVTNSVKNFLTSIVI